MSAPPAGYRLSPARTLADLTPRQRLYAGLAGDGLRVGEIERRAGREKKTIKNALSVIYHRTGCRDLSDLRLWVCRQRWQCEIEGRMRRLQGIDRDGKRWVHMAGAIQMTRYVLTGESAPPAEARE